MATIQELLIISSLCVTFLVANPLSSATKEHTQCELTCRKSYNVGLESPDGPNSLSLVDSCCRGCRFYTIVEVLNKSADHNQCLKSCFENCRDAYLGRSLESEACKAGCTHQQPFDVRDKIQKMAETNPRHALPTLRDDNVLAGAFYPLMLMRSLYSSLARHSSLSVFTLLDKQGHAGRVLVIQSSPHVVVDFKDRRSRNFDDSVIEPEKISLLNTTEVLKNSQLNPAKSLGNEINAAQATSNPGNPSISSNGGDWLSCLAHRTGMPRLFICILLLLTALSMLWLCMSAAVTAPNQHMKLSINSGDLDYIRTLPEKKGILGVYPQAVVEARPLPTKVQVQQL